MTHQCQPPAAEWPGEEWRCPDCSAKWWADEVGRNRGSSELKPANRPKLDDSIFEWRRFEGR